MAKQKDLSSDFVPLKAEPTSRPKAIWQPMTTLTSAFVAIFAARFRWMEVCKATGTYLVPAPRKVAVASLFMVRPTGVSCWGAISWGRGRWDEDARRAALYAGDTTACEAIGKTQQTAVTSLHHRQGAHDDHPVGNLLIWRGSI